MRRRQTTDVLNARVFQESNIIELQLAHQTKATANDRYLNGKQHLAPGHYVYIKCPDISVIEWHPFSLSSVSNQLHCVPASPSSSLLSLFFTLISLK